MPVLNQRCERSVAGSVKDPAAWLARYQPNQATLGLDLAVQAEQAEQLPGRVPRLPAQHTPKIAACQTVSSTQDLTNGALSDIVVINLTTIPAKRRRKTTILRCG